MRGDEWYIQYKTHSNIEHKPMLYKGLEGVEYHSDGTPLSIHQTLWAVRSPPPPTDATTSPSAACPSSSVALWAGARGEAWP